MNIERKIRRNQLKTMMGTNKIQRAWEKEQKLRYGVDYERICKKK